MLAVSAVKELNRSKFRKKRAPEEQKTDAWWDENINRKSFWYIVTRTCLKIFPPDIFVFLLRYTVKLLILTIIDHAFYQADIVALTVFNIF